MKTKKRMNKRDIFRKDLENFVKKNFDEEMWIEDETLSTSMFFSINDIMGIYDVLKRKSLRSKK
jgi:hypothetical protein